MTAPHISYGRQDIRAEDIEAVVAVLRSDWLTQGPTVPRFEAALAKLCGAGHAVVVNSATSALHIACVALGLGPGDRLWTSPNTFTASANCGLYCGAQVDFVDIDLRTGNMSADALAAKLEQADAEGLLPKIVVPVHFAGQSCDMRRIKALGERYGFRIIEDAAHAVGGKYLGAPVGDCRYCDIAVFSFHPVKIITTGEGGAALTNDAEIAARMARLRSHGTTHDPARMQGEPDGAWYYEVERARLELSHDRHPGGARAVARSSGSTTMWRGARRSPNATTGSSPTAGSRCRGAIPTVRRRGIFTSIGWNEEAFGLSRADAFAKLRAAGIGVQVHYIPLHTHPYFRKLGFRPGQYPNAEAHYARAITIPLYAALTDAQQDTVVDRILELAA